MVFLSEKSDNAFTNSSIVRHFRSSNWARCLRNNNLQTALQISLSYALLAGFWLLVFDRLLEMFVSDPHQLTRLATYNGVSLSRSQHC
jgi:hypothetical protein